MSDERRLTAEELQPVIQKLLDHGTYFTIVIDMKGLTAENAAECIRDRWPDELIINFGDDGLVRHVVLQDLMLSFEAPFYSTFGASFHFRIPLSHIIMVGINATQRVQTITQPAKDRRGLKLVN